MPGYVITTLNIGFTKTFCRTITSIDEACFGFIEPLLYNPSLQLYLQVKYHYDPSSMDMPV